MSLILIERIANLNGPIIPDTLNGVLNGSEIDAHKFIITAIRDGAQVALTGAITASFLRADGAEVVLTGEIENGAATVTLAQSCYAVPGRFDLTIFVTADGVKTGVYACTGGVRNTTSGTIVDPGQIVPSVDDIIAKQEELAQDVADASSAIASAQNAVSYLAPVFSTNRTYEVGEYVTKDGALYICTTAVETAGAWDASKWQAVTFGEEVTDLKSAINNQDFSLLTDAVNLHAGYIDYNTNKFAGITGRFLYSILPIAPNQEITLASNGTIQLQYAILRDWTNPANDDSPMFSVDTNYNTVKKIGTSTAVETIIFTSPADAKYLYIYMGGTNFNRIPSVIMIDGYDRLKNLKYAVTKNRDSITNIKECIINMGITKLTDPINTHSGYIDSTTNLFTGIGGNFRYTLIPIRPGAEITLQSNGVIQSLYAILKEWSEPKSGDAPVFSVNSDWYGVKYLGTNATQALITFTAPEDAKYLYLFLGNLTYNRLPTVCLIDGFNYLNDITQNITGVRSKITIMQNNVGHFNRGKGLATEYHYLTDANKGSVLDAYKAMYSKYKPDYLGMQEFENNVPVYNGETISETISTVSTLYNKLFDTIYFSESLNSKPCVAIKDIVIKKEHIHFSYTYTYNGNTITKQHWLIDTVIQHDRKVIDIVTLAFPSGAGDELMAQRQAVLNTIFEMQSGYDYAFIVCDLNNIGIAEASTLDNSISEGESLLTIMENNGYSDSMGSYFPWSATWKGFETTRIAAIDNILYKNNGKIRIESLEILDGLYNDLISDHVPFVASFILY